ncbi:histidine phosphatase family protein [Deinococcus sp.]|uniref:histidine phosphatase family protein n=1 Tax=Deinococcus sp. TaxID=47478 RepID=UPI00260023C1|nr:histidine phosphatase family protein [Deinococcus sp.]
MPLLDLTLVRHATTAWNTAGRWQGHSDVPLSAQGEAQGRALSKRLRGQEYDAAYSSDLLRTRRTAELALGQAVSPVLDARLRELHFGAFEGRELGTNTAHPGWPTWRADPWNEATPGGESLAQVAARLGAWAGELPNGRIIAFSHGLAIRALLHHLLGWPVQQRPEHPYPFPFQIKLEHTSLTRLRRTPHGWEVLSLGDCAHLEKWAGVLEQESAPV